MALIKKHYLLIGILLLGLFFRAYRMQALFMYSHDQDLSAWIVADVLENRHLRLIGQETSVGGVFIGMLYYYLLVPFFVLSGMDPVGGLWLSTILGIGAIVSFYFVFSRVFDKRVGLLVALIYSLNFNIIFNDREVVPTMPVMLWSVWYFYAVYLVLEGKQKTGFLLTAALVGLVWHLNLALIILLPLVPLALLLSKKKLEVQHLVRGLVLAFVVLLPFVVFELRHNFIQIKSITLSFIGYDSIVVSKFAKFDRVMQLVIKNTGNLVGSSGFDFPQIYVFLFVLVVLGFLIYRRLVDWKIGLVCYLWIFIYISFFTLNSINVSEYYFNGMAIIIILVMSVFLDFLLRRGNLKKLGVVFIFLYVGVNLYRFFGMDINRSGYLERKAIVSEIKADSARMDYPCVSVSYITKPGYELGYRYFFRMNGMHVNNPSSGSPVYTVVFPHSMVDRIDRSFGALGLIYPDYGKYDLGDVVKSCSGQNSNLTDPLFGYTE